MAKKNTKKYSAKKLPKLYRKKYSARKFDSKILKKIYVPKDKKAVEDIFEKSKDKKGHVQYSVSLEREFTKAELKSYKLIAKQIKGQKCRVKFLPLIAVVSFVAALVIVVGIFKNPIAKKVLISVSQNIFGAKTEVVSVDLGILDARVTVKGYTVGNKNDVMSNLFQADKIEVDFNLSQALRGRFNAENLEVSGMAFNTPRETSCELPVKEKKIAEKREESQFFNEIKSKNEDAVVALKNLASEVAGGGNPQEIADGIIASLSTPKVVENVKSTGERLSEKWKGKPEELGEKINKFAFDVSALQSIDPSKITDVATLKNDLEKIDSALRSGDSLKKSCESLDKDFNADFNDLKKLVSSAESGVKNDISYAQKKVNGLVTTVSNPQKLFDQALNTVAYSYLGKYYDYFQIVYSYAKEIKISSINKSGSEKSKEKPKKQGAKRLAGTTFWYKTEQPSFLIENVKVSGPGFEASAQEITNDPDVRGKPATVRLGLNLNNVTHGAKLVIDARSKTENPLIKAEYTGSGFAVAFDGTTVAAKCGIPSVESKAGVKAVLSMDWNDTASSLDVLGEGSVKLSGAKIYSDGFENDVISKYYNDALGCVKNLSVDFTTGFTALNGLSLGLSGNFNDFTNGFKKSASNASKDLQNAVLAKVKDYLSGYSSQISSSMEGLKVIKSAFDKDSNTLNNIQKQLDDKKAEIEKQIKASAAKAGKDAVSNALKGFGF